MCGGMEYVLERNCALGRGCVFGWDFVLGPKSASGSDCVCLKCMLGRDYLFSRECVLRLAYVMGRLCVLRHDCVLGW